MKNIKIKQEILENHKIILIFGVPCSGKSILTYNTFLKGKPCEIHKDIMKYTETSEHILLGTYNTETNRKGLDTIERKQVGNLASQIKNLIKTDKTVILEGMRCISRPMMSQMNPDDIVMLWIDCNLDECVSRANLDRELKGHNQLKLIQSSFTMCYNFTNEFLSKCPIFLIDTSECHSREDFENKTLFDFDWTRKVTLW